MIDSLPQNSISKIKKNTQFLCFLGLVLKVVLVLLLFLPGMFNITHNYSNHFSANTLETKIFSVSFLKYSLADLDIFDLGRAQVDIEATTVLFFIVAAFMIIEITFSTIRILKPILLQKGKFQLILSVLIFVLLITISVWFNFDRSNGMKFYEYELTFTDEITGEVSRTIETWSETFVNNGWSPGSSYNTRITGLITYTNTISFGFLFYLVVLLLIAILAIDFYVIRSYLKDSGLRKTGDGSVC